MSYYPRSEPKEAKDLTLTGQKRRLQKLEDQIQKVRLTRELVSLEEVVAAVKRLNAGIPDGIAFTLCSPPLNFVFPQKGEDTLKIPGSCTPDSISRLFNTVILEIKATQLARVKLQKDLFQKFVFPKYRLAELEEYDRRERQYNRLFEYRALLESVSETIGAGPSTYGQIVELRALIAKGEETKERLLKQRIFAPVAPSPEEILRARVASYDQKSRDIVGALRSKVAQTDNCPYCTLPIGEEGYEFDHIIPVSRGGMSIEDNLIWICYSCNRRKRDMALLEFAKVAGFPIEPLVDRLHRMGKRC